MASNPNSMPHNLAEWNELAERCVSQAQAEYEAAVAQAKGAGLAAIRIEFGGA